MAPRLAAAGRDPGGAEAAAAAQRLCADSNGNGGERDVHSPAGEEVVCRYCLEEEPREELFRPCRCTNPVHTSCLRTWLTGGDRAARRLECELCKSTIAAKISLAPYAVLLREREGRSILAGTLLRLAYRFFLCRRVFTRYRTVIHRWLGICSRGNPLADGVTGFFERAALYRDSLVGVLLGWLCWHMLIKDITTFRLGLARLRTKRASLVFIFPNTDKAKGEGGADDGLPGRTTSHTQHHGAAASRTSLSPAAAPSSLSASLHEALRAFVDSVFGPRYTSHSTGMAAMRLSLGFEITQWQAEMALGLR